MKQLYILSFLLLFCFIGFAQRTIIGSISSEKNSKPIPFATIISNTGIGTFSDSYGEFSLEIKDNTTSLTFSIVGYESKTITLSDQNNLSVILSENTTELNEVVVTALGIKRESKSLGYAVQSLYSKDLTEVKTENFLDNISGKIAGVKVTRGATGVGSSSKISIRGEASFTNNNPLFIIDGTPINNNTTFNQTNEAAAGFQEVDFGNGAMDINADDIETLTVLKGPSAAALYGTRASNGVIVITTKNGKNTKGLGIEIQSTVFVDNAFTLPKFQNQYGQGNSGKFQFVDGLGAGINDNITYSWGPKLDTGLLIQQFDSPVLLANGLIVRGGDTSLYNGNPITPTPFVSNPDNLKNFYQTAITTQNNIAIANAFDTGNFRMSFTDLNSESIIPGVNFKRKNLATKLNFTPSVKTKISGSINYINSESDNRPSNGYGSENVNYSLVAWGPRSLNIENLKNYWQPGLEGRQQYSYNYTFFDNPYFILNENKNSFEKDRIFGNVSFTNNITQKLTVSLRSGMDYSFENRRLRRAFSSNRFKNGAYAEHDVLYREINSDFLINYKDQFSDFNVDIAAGGNTLSQKATTKQTQTINLAQPSIFNLNNAASPIEVFQLASTKKINSLYGIAKLTYKNFLYIDLTARNDWSIALATPTSSKNTSFFYPSISSAFVFSNIFKLPEFVSFAKLRTSIAQVGNDTNPYQTSSVFNSQTTVNGEPTFSHQNFVPNQNLSPEKTTSYEIGTDIKLFNSRINLDMSYYQAITENQIISLPIPISSGYNQQVVNGGKVKTTGWEFVADLEILKTKSLKWNSLFNFSTYQSTIVNLPQEEGRLTLGYSRIYDSANQTVWLQVEKGGKIGDLYGTGYLRNENNDFIIDNNGNFIVDNSLKKLGNYNPNFTLGWTNNIAHKNWNLNFVLDWNQGGIIVSRTRALGNVGGQLAETAYRPENGIIAKGVVNIGTNEIPNYVPNTNAISAESYYRQFYDRNHEENNIYDASFLKLRQFSISYTLKLSKKSTRLKEGALLKLSLIGKNLFAITENPHFDPEQIAVQGNGFISGVEDLSYATTRSFGLNVGLKF